MKRSPFAVAIGAASVLAVGYAVPLAQESSSSLPEDWSDFEHIHSLVIAEEESPLFGFHHFYIGEIGRETFASQSGFAYPEGTTFIGAVYEVASDGVHQNEGPPAIYTLMVKGPAAEETGGCRFAVYRPDGTLIEQDVGENCFECHTQVSDSDYVFSRPLELWLS